jgi:hypothetical protein
MTAALVIEQQALRGHFFTKIDKFLLERVELPEFHCKAVLGSFLVQSRPTFAPHGDVCLTVSRRFLTIFADLKLDGALHTATTNDINWPQ